MVGRHSDVALRRAARADGWLGVDYEIEELERLLKKLKAYRREFATQHKPFEIFAVLKQFPDLRTLERMAEPAVSMTQDHALRSTWVIRQMAPFL